MMNPTSLQLIGPLLPFDRDRRRHRRRSAGCSPPGCGSSTAIRSTAPGARRSIRKKNDETIERVKLLSQENAQLRAELGAVKDRLANVERIVTDDSHRLTQEIEALRLPRN